MKFRFMGNYTNGHESIDAGGVLFHDRDPSEVPDENADLIRRLSNNPEFQKVKAANAGDDASTRVTAASKAKIMSRKAKAKK